MFGIKIAEVFYHCERSIGVAKTKIQKGVIKWLFQRIRKNLLYGLILIH